MAKNTTTTTINNNNTATSIATTTSSATTPTAPTLALALALVSHQPTDLALISRLATLPADRWINEINEEDWVSIRSLLATGTLGLSHCPFLLHQGMYNQQ